MKKHSLALSMALSLGSLAPAFAGDSLHLGCDGKGSVKVRGDVLKKLHTVHTLFSDQRAENGVDRVYTLTMQEGDTIYVGKGISSGLANKARVKVANGDHVIFKGTVELLEAGEGIELQGKLDDEVYTRAQLNAVLDCEELDE